MAILFTLMALARGAVYATVLPPWQSNDEHGHFEYAWLVSQHGPFVGPESISPDFQQRVLESMYEHEYWRYAQQPMPEELPQGFTDPADPWLRQSRPQVGDERPLYYWLTGGVLRMLGEQDLLTGMYIGRVVSIVLFAAAIWIAVKASSSLFPESRFMQVVPPAFMLFLPVLGQMAASVSSDSMGVLSCTLFFVGLIPIFRDGTAWRRLAAAGGALALALLSKKAALFLLPVAGTAPVVYYLGRHRSLSRPTWLTLMGVIVTLGVVCVGLRFLPSGNAAGWLQVYPSAGPTRTEEDAIEGRAAIRVGPGARSRVSQTLVPEVAVSQAGRELVFRGWARSASGPLSAHVAVADRDDESATEVWLDTEWRTVVVSHVVAANPRWISVRLKSDGQGQTVLFDGLQLTAAQGGNLLRNPSAEVAESMLLDVARGAARALGVPGAARLAEFALSPVSYDRRGLSAYVAAAEAAFRSFWGLFGSVTLRLPRSWYRVAGAVCLLALAGIAASVANRRASGWRAGYLVVLAVGSMVLVLVTILPSIGMRGTTWLPQGRYLFPSVFGFAILGSWGWRHLLPRCWDRWTTLMAFSGLALFDVLTLGLVFVPYYQGG